MWDNAFNEDDPDNPELADEYGIVMGTSHHEPMMRAQKEWNRHGYYGNGAVELRDQRGGAAEFWSDGIVRNKQLREHHHDGDARRRRSSRCPTGRMQANIAAAGADRRRPAADPRQRAAIRPDREGAAALGALQGSAGVLREGHARARRRDAALGDDNWGNIRRLPTPEERKRSGGAGIYYHFDYVADPRLQVDQHDPDHRRSGSR